MKPFLSRSLMVFSIVACLAIFGFIVLSDESGSDAFEDSDQVYTYNISVSVTANEYFTLDSNCGYHPDVAVWDYEYVSFIQPLSGVSISSSHVSGSSSYTSYTKYTLTGILSAEGTYTCVVQNCTDFDSYHLYNTIYYTIVVTDSGDGDSTLFHQFDLIIDGNGGSSTTLSGKTDSYTFRYTFNVSGVSLLRSGYTFKGLATSPSATSPNISGTYTVEYSEASHSMTFTSTIYAVWSAINVPDEYLYYAVLFDSKGGSSVNSFEAFEINTVLSHSFDISSYSSTRSGYSFLGWSLSADGTKNSVVTSVTVVNNGSEVTTLTVYAVWLEGDSNPWDFLSEIWDRIVDTLGHYSLEEWTVILSSLIVLVFFVKYVIFNDRGSLKKHLKYKRRRR